MYEDLERVCTSIATKVFWAEGWSAARETEYYDSKGFTPDVTKNLARVEGFFSRRGQSSVCVLSFWETPGE
jgi:hypothetical protein